MSTQRENLLCHYRYNALDQLIGHTQPNEPPHQRFYRKNRLVTEIQGAMKYSIFQSGDLLLAQQRSEANALDTTLLVTDQQRSVLHTLEANRQRRPVAYSPYGHHHPENGLLSLLGFNGERPDPVTGHYVLGNGYRAFNPVTMRFNGPDGFSPFGKGGLNSYAYCLGDPVNLSDPNGTNPPFLSRMFGKIGGLFASYKSGPGQTFSEFPENRVFAQNSYTDVAAFTPPQDIKLNNWREITHRSSETAEGQGVKIKDVIGMRHDQAVVIVKNRVTRIKRNRPIKLIELSYAQIPGDELAFNYRKFDMPEIDISTDHRNLLNARDKLIRSMHDRQINVLAKKGMISGVRPSRAKILIKDNSYTNDNIRWWDDPTLHHTIIR
ncbi:RHS repeat-associated core domain-containing protein [Pseudomonas sp. PB120]|uniref:RHS repeat-associated core domain-containing protein n=1 Tax=Pseudomonas sp. PB120 TaxID=2494700 RepID=UPI0012FD45CF|nr:RHS repeat-associated core domain-containing protein [Pseudomonas sp. PB120]MVV46968.1 RHS repeat-associated core domain-containing protein [Pseudomonas sp. PB120]